MACRLYNKGLQGLIGTMFSSPSAVRVSLATPSRVFFTPRISRLLRLPSFELHSGMSAVNKVRPHPGSLSPGLQIAQSRFYVQTLDPKVATICILGAVGYGSKRPPTEADPQTPAFLKGYLLHPSPEPLVLYLKRQRYKSPNTP